MTVAKKKKKKKKKLKRKEPTAVSRLWLWQFSEGKFSKTHGEKIRHLKSVGFLTKNNTLTMSGKQTLAEQKLFMQAKKDALNYVEQQRLGQENVHPTESPTGTEHTG
jgi:NAD-dependent DNA ligase